MWPSAPIGWVGRVPACSLGTLKYPCPVRTIVGRAPRIAAIPEPCPRESWSSTPLPKFPTLPTPISGPVVSVPTKPVTSVCKPCGLAMVPPPLGPFESLPHEARATTLAKASVARPDRRSTIMAQPSCSGSVESSLPDGSLFRKRDGGIIPAAGEHHVENAEGVRDVPLQIDLTARNRLERAVIGVVLARGWSGDSQLKVIGV